MSSKLIIEFNGLPGTGKSTICAELEKILEDRHFVVLKKYPKGSFTSRFVSICAKFGAIRLGKLLKKYGQEFSSNTMRKTIYDGIARMFYSYIIFNTFLKPNQKTIMLKDQGIVQGILSIAHTERIKNESSLFNLFRYLNQSRCFFLRVECKANSDISFERILARSKMGSRFDRMQVPELKNNLLIQADNLSLIRRQFSILEDCKYNSIVINTECSPKDNAEFICNFINSIIDDEK